MKKCPFCAEEIQDEAIKCRFCDEFLDSFTPLKPHGPKIKWYFSRSSVVVSLLCLGPLALPLVWVHPHYGIVKKLVITVLVVVITVWACLLMKNLYVQLRRQLQELMAY